MNGNAARPAVSLQCNRGADENQADEQQRVVAVPVLRPEAPDPAEDQADDEDRQEEPAAQPGHVRPSVSEAEMVDRLELELGDLLAPSNDRLVLGELDLERLDEVRPLGALLLGQRRTEGRVRDDERGDDLGGERPLLGPRPPAISPESCAWTGATSESRSSPRSVRSRTSDGFGPDRCPAARASRTKSVARASSGRSGRAAASSVSRWSAGVVSANAWSIGRTRSSNSPELLLGGRARLGRGEVVHAAPRRPGPLPSRLVRLDVADVLVGARRDDVGRGHGPDIRPGAAAARSPRRGSSRGGRSGPSRRSRDERPRAG